MFWAFEKSIFQFFTNFWVAKLKPYSGNVTESVKNYLNQNLIMALKLPWSQNKCSERLKRAFFQFFPNFGGESEAKRSSLFKSKFGHRKLLRKWFWSYLEPKKTKNILSVWKEHFSVFCTFLSDEVETVFWESEAKRLKLFESKFGDRKLLGK